MSAKPSRVKFREPEYVKIWLEISIAIVTLVTVEDTVNKVG